MKLVALIYGVILYIINIFVFLMGKMDMFVVVRINEENGQLMEWWRQGRLLIFDQFQVVDRLAIIRP